jgi:NTE family protein
MSSPGVSLVIGSGGIKCAAALGLWKVLRREGIKIESVVGCSGGSIFATLIALGFDYDQCLQITLDFWSPGVFRYYRPAFLQLLMPWLFGFNPRFGLLDDRQAMAIFQNLFSDRTFAQTQIPLHIVAADLLTGEKVVLSEGRIVDAMRASIAIPILFRPWPINGRLLIDGGAADPMPVDVAIREGSQVIIALGFETPYSPQVRSLWGLVNQTFSIIVNNLLVSSFAFHNLAHHAELVPLVIHFDRPIGLSDTHLLPDIIAEGERAAEMELPYLKRLLAAEQV